MSKTVALAILSLMCGGFAQKADGEENMSFVQTTVSGITISGYVESQIDFNFQPEIAVESGSVALNFNSAEPILRGDINLISDVSYQGTLMDLSDSASSHYISVETTPTVQTVPEPSSFALGGLVCATFATFSLRKRGLKSC